MKIIKLAKRQRGWFSPAIWVLALSVLFAQSGSPAYLAYAQEADADLEAQIAQLEKLFDALEAAKQELPRDTFDVNAVLALTDGTPEGIFAWVRDNTYLVPYKGALRGEQGVLMDRVGNSLDRALLLQSLIRLSGHNAQLARAQLSEVQAQEILANTRTIPAEGALPQTSDTALNEKFQQYASDFGLDQAQLEAIAQQAKEQQETFRANLTERSTSQTDFLKTLVTSENDMNAETAKQIAALQDHWWVQYQENDEWLDLDPTLPDAGVGQSITAASETFSSVAVMGDLSAELLHTVQVRVVLECWQDGGLTEKQLVASAPTLPSLLLGKSFAIKHFPSDWQQDVDSAEAFRAAVQGQKSFVTGIQIGSEFVSSNPYTQDCSDGTEEPAGDVGGAVGDLFGGGFGGDETEAASVGQVTAEWIEYTIHVPGENDQVIRRQIFDVLGPAARAAGVSEQPEFSEDQQLSWKLALFGDTDILVLPHQLSADYVSLLSAEALQTNRQVLTDMLRNSNDLAKITEISADITPAPGLVYALALARQNLSSTKVYIDRPNILSYHKQTKFTVQGDVASLQGFDIVANHVAVLPTVADPFAERLMQGVLDTNAEALLASLACQGGNEFVCPQVVNAAELLELSNQQGITWRKAQSAEDLTGLELSDDVRAHIEQDLANGYAVVLPKQALQVGEDAVVNWWRVNAVSGQSLGVGETGWGQSATEYIKLLRKAASSTFCVAAAATKSNGTKLLLCFAGLFINSFSFAAGVNGFKGFGEFLEVISTAISGYAGFQ